ncbi:MAG: helix-turn-helix domain-containing protein [Treponema sp.]|jgi:transcriptional regulator with XRE-family HTH domain|nr:helix-turn-helix domain-containing protein [Treponema sp.]
MGFKENLKSELAYSGMLVKELASLSGINKRTIDNYLNTHNCIPSADAAVRIAAALGVTVEYLITGNVQQERGASQPVPDSRVILKNLEALNKRDRKIVVNLIKSLKDLENTEKKAR